MSSTTPAVRSTDGFDLGRALKFVFEDPNWVRKMLIGGVFALASVFVIGGVFIAGYMLRLMRRVAAGDLNPLPEWDDLGAIFSEGLPLFGIYLCHAFGLALIPAFIAMCGVGMGILVGGGHDSSGAGGALVAIGMLGAEVLFAVVMLLLMVYLPAAVARYAIYGQFKSAFQVRENIDWIRRNLGNYAMAVVGFLIANFASQFGILLCCVGVFVTSFWSNCVLAWGIGEVIRRDPAGLAARSGL
jgi:hypothetical protein